MNAPLIQIADPRRRRVMLNLRPRSTVARMRALKAARPVTRGDCVGGIRPCPWATCKHHLVHAQKGFAYGRGSSLEDMTETCALDVADRGPVSLEDVGALINLTRERVRQVESNGRLAFFAMAPELRSYVSHADAERADDARDSGTIMRAMRDEGATAEDTALYLVSIGRPTWTLGKVQRYFRAAGLAAVRAVPVGKQGVREQRMRRVGKMLRETGDWLTSSQVQEVIGGNIKATHYLLRDMVRAGLIETRRGACANEESRHRWKR